MYIRSIPTDNIEEAQSFIFKKLNECLLFTSEVEPDSIYHIWDNRGLREKKLCRLIGKEMTFKPGQNSIVMFEEDYKRGYFWYDYNKIYSVLRDKYLFNHQEIDKLIKKILENNNSKSLIPVNTIQRIYTIMENDNRWQSLIPNVNWTPILLPLNINLY